MHGAHYEYGIFEEGCSVVVLLGALRALMLERKLIALDVTDIVRVEGARLLIHGLFKILQCLTRFGGDARQMAGAKGVLGPDDGEFGHERGLVLR